MQENNTFPPCKQCDAHEGLEQEVHNLKQKNTDEHQEILKALDAATMNIKWMTVIGRWILASLLGYFVGLAYYILSFDFPDNEVIAQMQHNIDKGDRLHYSNEIDIAIIKSKLEEIHQFQKDNK